MIENQSHYLCNKERKSVYALHRKKMWNQLRYIHLHLHISLTFCWLLEKSKLYTCPFRTKLRTFTCILSDVDQWWNSCTISTCSFVIMLIKLHSSIFFEISFQPPCKKAAMNGGQSMSSKKHESSGHLKRSIGSNDSGQGIDSDLYYQPKNK